MIFLHRTRQPLGRATILSAMLASSASADAYRDPWTNLTFDPPAGWMQEPPVADAKSTLVRFVRPPDVPGGSKCVVAIGSSIPLPELPVGTVKSLDKLARNFQWHSAQPPTNGRVGPIVDTTVGGLAAKTMTMDADSKTGPTKIRYWLTITNGRFVTVAYGGPEPLYTAHLAEAEASVASI